MPNPIVFRRVLMNHAAVHVPPPSGSTFAFAGKEGQVFNPATSATFTTINIGAAAADRYVIVAIWNQNGRAIDAVTVGGVSLAEDVEITPGRGLSIFSGLVTTGSGVQNIVATASTGGIFEALSHSVREQEWRTRRARRRLRTHRQAVQRQFLLRQAICWSRYFPGRSLTAARPKRQLPEPR